jgi:hypothetical protein
MRAGTSYYKNETKFTQTRRIVAIIQHPDYDDDFVYFDAGIAIAERKVEFSDYIRPICLPVKPVDALDYLTGEIVTLTGFGLDSTTNTLVKTIKFIDLKVREILFEIFFPYDLTHEKLRRH